MGKKSKGNGAGVVEAAETPSGSEAGRPPTLNEAIIALFESSDLYGMTATEIGERLEVPWTPDDLTGTLAAMVHDKLLTMLDDGLDGAVYELLPPNWDDDRAAIIAGRAAVERALADESRMRRTRYLRCELTEEEREAARLQAQRVNREADEADARVNKLAAELKLAKEEVAAATTKLRRALRLAEDGVEQRDVECIEVVLAQHNTALTFRVDTMEVVDERELSTSERQGELFPATGAAVTAGAMQ